jgi:hypothetical protein
MAPSVTQTQCRSNRINLGNNGRDVQLNRLGEQLTAATRQKKRRFAPEEGLTLEVNALAPATKKSRSKGRSKVCTAYLSHVFLTTLTTTT